MMLQARRFGKQVGFKISKADLHHLWKLLIALDFGVQIFGENHVVISTTDPLKVCYHPPTPPHSPQHQWQNIIA